MAKQALTPTKGTITHLEITNNIFDYITTRMLTTNSTPPRNKYQENRNIKAHIRRWSHSFSTKDPAMLCLLLQNIGDINLTDTGSIKLAALWTFAQAAQVDICAITECNMAWNKALLICTHKNKCNIGGRAAIRVWITAHKIQQCTISTSRQHWAGNIESAVALQTKTRQW